MALQLCINISRTSAHFAEVLRSTTSVEREEHLTFSSEKTETIKEELNAFVKEKGFLKEYDEYSLAYWGDKYTIVPFNVFDSSNFNAVFQLCFGENNYNSNELDYTTQPHLGVTSIYEMPHWIKSFFIIKFPRIIIQHGISLQLNGMNSESNFRPNLHVHIEEGYFFLTLFKQTNLVFSNCFEFQNENDIAYHLVYMLKKMKVTEEDGQINISGKSKSLNLDTLIETLSTFTVISKFKKQISEDRVLKHHLLCV
ncbi:MAG: DUF3822 family protein [Lishizhenia sp.]